MRIISLLPSATEILCAVGGRDMLVGRSHECDFPPGLEGVPVLTGEAARTQYTTAAETDRQVRAALGSGPAAGEDGPAGQSLYTLDADLLRQLRPDLILTQDLCHVCSIDLRTVQQVAATMNPPPPVLSLNPQTLEGVFDDLLSVGWAVGLERGAESALVKLRERMYAAGDFVNPYADGPVVAFLEWPDPLFIGGHWTPQLIERAGGRHPLNPTQALRQAGAAAGPVGTTLRKAGRSVTVPPEVLVASRPDFVVVCPCGLDLERTRREVELLSKKDWWGELPAVQSGRVALVDGNQMFNRPGPRLVDAFEWLVGWLNNRPEVIPVGFPWEVWEG